MALEVSGWTGSTMDAKVSETRLDVDIFSIYPWKWNVEETVYREYDCNKEFIAACKLIVLLLNLCNLSIFVQYTNSV